MKTPGLKNNWDYFHGKETQKNLDLARGFSKTTVFGDSVQSGGIHQPRVRKIAIDQGPLIRFFSSRHPVSAESDAWHGNWWITRQCLKSLASIASDNRESLEAVASRFLFVPREWSDLGKCVIATLTLECWAYEGKGKFYSKTLPDKDNENAGFKAKNQYDEFKRADKLYGYAPKDGAFQLYIPGSAAEFRQMMSIRTGWTSELRIGGT